METSGQVWFGWIDSMARSDFVWLAQRAPQVFSKFPYACISCLNKTRHQDLHYMVDLVEEAQRFSHKYEEITGGLLVTGEAMARLALPETNLFNGFDETWLFSRLPQANLDPPCQLSSEAPITGVGLVRWRTQVAQWMCAANCDVGLGDGIGLNFATTNKAVADFLTRVAEEGGWQVHAATEF